MGLNSLLVMHFLSDLYTRDKECSLCDPFSSNCDQAAENGNTGGNGDVELRLMKMYASRNVLFSERKFQLQDICYTIISSTEF
jgi:hypothetical protein